MIEVLRISIHRLNGQIITRRNFIEPKSMVFKTGDQLEEYRYLREAKLQWKSDQQYRLQHPHMNDEEFEAHKPRVKVSIDTRSKEGYHSPSIEQI